MQLRLVFRYSHKHDAQPLRQPDRLQAALAGSLRPSASTGRLRRTLGMPAYLGGRKLKSMEGDFELDGVFALDGQVEAARLCVHLGDSHFSVSDAAKKPPKRELILYPFLRSMLSCEWNEYVGDGIRYSFTTSVPTSINPEAKVIFVVSNNGLLWRHTVRPIRYPSR